MRRNMVPNELVFKFVIKNNKKKGESVMKNFICDHPLISLLMVGTVCKTAIEITKIIKGECDECDEKVTIHGFIFPKKTDEKSEVKDKKSETEENKKEEIVKED